MWNVEKNKNNKRYEIALVVFFFTVYSLPNGESKHLQHRLWCNVLNRRHDIFSSITTLRSDKVGRDRLFQNHIRSLSWCHFHFLFSSEYLLLPHTQFARYCTCVSTVNFKLTSNLLYFTRSYIVVLISNAFYILRNRRNDSTTTESSPAFKIWVHPYSDLTTPRTSILSKYHTAPFSFAKLWRP